MTYYLIAGEASGDLHASNLMKALKQVDNEAEFRYWGGDLMKSVGGILVKHYQELAFMGFWEVIKNLSTISKNLDFCKKDIATHLPDVLILIDYSGFNLRIAQWAKTVGLKVFYYISPQVWASRSNRVKKIKKYVDQLFVILPFEPIFYRKFGMEVDFVGHPLLDAIADFNAKEETEAIFSNSKPIIALLPGSRKQEIQSVFPVMLSLVNEFKDYQWVVGVAPSIPIDLYEKLLAAADLNINEVILLNQTYSLLDSAKATLVTSGTATLEAALFNVPQVVCYKGNWLTYQIAKRIIKVPYISLVNLIANRLVVKELIQDDLTVGNLRRELFNILDKEKARKQKKAYAKIRNQLGNEGASLRTAQLMVQYLKREN